MKAKLIYYLFAGALLITSCGPSEADLATTAQAAIQETQTARPSPSPLAAEATLEPSPMFLELAPSSTPKPVLDIGATKLREADNMTMMYVPAGDFTMGWNDGASNEWPEHRVTLGAFWIDQTEVTMAQYALCVAAGPCTTPTIVQPSGDSPVVNVAWADANAYCTLVGARLPTEAEWEKAARGTDERIYPWGDEFDEKKLAVFTWKSKMPAVGRFPGGASPYGVLDMAGSAFEWVADWFSPSYYSHSPKLDPRGPASGKFHVIRGGWWEYCPSNYICGINPTYRSTYRNGTGIYGRGGDGPAWKYYPGAGFRCAASP